MVEAQIYKEASHCSFRKIYNVATLSDRTLKYNYNLENMFLLNCVFSCVGWEIFYLAAENDNISIKLANMQIKVISFEPKNKNLRCHGKL